MMPFILAAIARDIVDWLAGLRHRKERQKELDEIDGVMNESADRVERIDKAWSDTNFIRDFDACLQGHEWTFRRLKCRQCGKTDRFEVLQTGAWETTAKCTNCGMYYIVHTG